MFHQKKAFVVVQLQKNRSAQERFSDLGSCQRTLEAGFQFLAVSPEQTAGRNDDPGRFHRIVPDVGRSGRQRDLAAPRKRVSGKPPGPAEGRPPQSLRRVLLARHGHLVALELLHLAQQLLGLQVPEHERREHDLDRRRKQD